MRISKGFKMRDLCGVNIVTPSGLEQANFNKMMTLNETAAFLWESIKESDFNEETLADLLCSEYEVSRETALADAVKLINDWKEAGVLED